MKYKKYKEKINVSKYKARTRKKYRNINTNTGEELRWCAAGCMTFSGDSSSYLFNYFFYHLQIRYKFSISQADLSGCDNERRGKGGRWRVLECGLVFSISFNLVDWLD